MGQVATLVSTNREGVTRRWPITDDDVLWMARMLVAEDGTYSDAEEGYRVGRVMTSMLVHRLAVQMFDGPFTSLTHLLRGNPTGGNPRGWSQPLRYYGLLHGTATERARYERHQSRTWNEIPDYYQRAALDTLTGAVPLLHPAIVDAAAASFVAARINQPEMQAAGWRIENAGTRSTLISTSRSRSWPQGAVRIVGGAAGIGAGTLLVGLAVLVGLALAYGGRA